MLFGEINFEFGNINIDYIWKIFFLVVLIFF